MTSKRTVITVSRLGIVVAAVTASCFVIACATIIALFVKDTQSSLQFIALLIAQIPVLITAVTILSKIESVDDKTERVLNGEMTTKVESAIHRALDERESRDLPVTEP